MSLDMIRLPAVYVLFLVAGTWTGLGGQPAPAPRVVSPEVHSDGTVTFRLRAPNAREVSVSGEFTPKPQPMTTSAADEGIWSLTTAALPPDTYGYSFRVDNTSISDPANPLLAVGISGPVSLLRVPSPKPHAWDLQEVPHGTVHHHFYTSSAAKDTREVVVYTPPGYEASPRATYPVLYLLHGSGDLATSWVDRGYANRIADNLLADGKSKAMLIVMPFGHMLTQAQRNDPAARDRNLSLFAEDLTTAIIPLVEKTYRVRTSRADRAIAGLSMGGGQTLYTGLRNPEKFDYVVGFSSSIPTPEQLPPAEIKAPKLLWLGIGKDDFLLAQNETFDSVLTRNKIQHTYRVTEGAHSWLVWRRYLAEVLPLLFR